MGAILIACGLPHLNAPDATVPSIRINDYKSFPNLIPLKQPARPAPAGEQVCVRAVGGGGHSGRDEAVQGGPEGLQTGFCNQELRELLNWCLDTQGTRS